LNPECIGTDFELALYNSVNIVFPKTTVVPMFFHLSKALWENAARRGLRKIAFREQTKKLIAMIKCLAFTPLDRVMEKFLWIKNCFDGPEFDGFLKYVEKVWLSETPYPPSLWNIHEYLLSNDNLLSNDKNFIL